MILAMLVLVLGIVVLAGVCLYLYYVLTTVREELSTVFTKLRYAEDKAEQAEKLALQRASEYLKREEARLRKDAIARSEHVVKGKVAEQLVPFGEEFGYNPRDARFLGSPLDFLVFEGMAEGMIDRIVFIEVKTGMSRLSKRERQVRDAVDSGEVYYEVLSLGGK